MSRLQTGALELHAQPIGLDEVDSRRSPSLGAEAARSTRAPRGPTAACCADAGLLERALANVVANAAAYSPARIPTPRRRRGGRTSGVDIRVVDRGPGVPTAERERMFVPVPAPGRLRAGEGVGLGLAVARGFVEAMSGSIEVEDTPGGGLTVVVRLQGSARDEDPRRRRRAADPTGARTRTCARGATTSTWRRAARPRSTLAARKHPDARRSSTSACPASTGSR